MHVWVHSIEKVSTSVSPRMGPALSMDKVVWTYLQCLYQLNITGEDVSDHNISRKVLDIEKADSRTEGVQIFLNMEKRKDN